MTACAPPAARQRRRLTRCPAQVPILKIPKAQALWQITRRKAAKKPKDPIQVVARLCACTAYPSNMAYVQMCARTCARNVCH